MKIIHSYNIIAALLLGVSLFTLALVLLSQYGFGLAPCDLCIYQRIPYVVVALFAALALIVKSSTSLQRGLLWLCVLSLLVGGGIAAYHTGVEQKIFAGPDSCAEDGIDGGDSIEELRKKILQAQVVRCDEPAIELWGILTMASANMLLSFTLAIWAGISLLRPVTADKQSVD